MNGPPVQQYWETKLPQGVHIHKELDLQALERVMSKRKPSRHRWVTKHITGHFAHGKNMARQGQRSTAACPRCRNEVKDKSHIIRCQAESAQKQCEISTQKLNKWMKDQGTALEIHTMIMAQATGAMDE